MQQPEAIHPLVFAGVDAPGWRVGGRLERGLEGLGLWMRRYRGVLLMLQWAVVLVYAVLLVVPVFLPLPRGGEAIWDSLTLMARFAFWGIWWPFVILSMMLLGRVWCGVLCPEGTLTEWASRRGLGWKIPRWLRWSGWPLVAFVMTTVYGQLISVYEYPRATLLILGGSTVAAVGVGLLFGKGKRVWCRYLCPASGVFALLAKLAPLHFRTDRERWRRYPVHVLRAERVDCAPMLDVAHLQSASNCHACGRCAGEHDAVALGLRSPHAEVLQSPITGAQTVSGNSWSRQYQDGFTAQALLLIFGMFGVAMAAFQWSMSPVFRALRTWSVQWLLERDQVWLLQDNAPWWLLTHEPDVADSFTWLDGLLVLGYIGCAALLLGGFIWLCLWVAARLSGLDWRRLSLALLPLAGAGLFLGLSMLTVSQLGAVGIRFDWVKPLRMVLLGLAACWSIYLGWRLMTLSRQSLAAASSKNWGLGAVRGQVGELLPITLNVCAMGVMVLGIATVVWLWSWMLAL